MKTNKNMPSAIQGVAPVAKKVASKVKVAFFAPLIEEAKFTRKELTEMALKNFPTLTESTVTTFLIDAKNPKYSAFSKVEGGKLVVEDKATKKLSFAA